MTTRAYNQSDEMKAIRKVFGQFTKAVQECERIERDSVISDFWFDEAFGHRKPAIFLKVRTDGRENVKVVTLEH